jgi:microcystin-dependent protein
MPLDPVLGQIMPFAGSVIPRGWALCNGATLAIQNYQALFALIGTYYGGDGIRTFMLPDLRGRAILGSSGSGGQYAVGMVGGNTQVTLQTAQLPQHSHTMQASTTSGSGRFPIQPAGLVFGVNTEGTKYIFGTAGSSEVALAPSTNIQNAGGNQAHNNMQPYLVISYLIALQGTFPSRN